MYTGEDIQAMLFILGCIFLLTILAMISKSMREAIKEPVIIYAFWWRKIRQWSVSDDR
jgi:hypothetical protein